MISFQNVNKTYDDGTVALDQVSFDIQKGEFVFLVGPSGAGKSTLTRLLLKEEEPTSGTIVIDGKRVDNLPKHQVPYLRRNIGVVFQDFRLLEDRDVYENVSFAMQIVGAPRKEIRRQVPFLLSLVGLAHKAKLYPNQLSRGEAQRVSLARALANNPPILLADEPTASLPPKTAFEIVDLICEINARGTTVVMATHAKEIVDSMKKRVVAIEDGLLVRDDSRGGYGFDEKPQTI